MRRRFAAVAASLLLVSGTAGAYDGFTSEFSHAVAGAAMAGAGTAIAGHFELEHRGWIGFGASSLVGLVSEGLQVASNPGAKMRSAWLDVGSNALGAAFGAWVTDRYLLRPVVAKGAAGHTAVGVVVHTTF